MGEGWTIAQTSTGLAHSWLPSAQQPVPTGFRPGLARERKRRDCGRRDGSAAAWSNTTRF